VALLRRLPLLALLGALAAARLGAEPAWNALRSRDFTVLSQLPERDTRAWAGEFRQFIRALQDVVPVDKSRIPPLTVVLFRGASRFGPYRPAGPDGKPVDAAGFFVRNGDWAMIGLSSRSTDAGTRHIIFHEGVHWCMTGVSGRYPLWFNEGLAEAFSTFRVENGRACWGDPLLGHIALLRERPMLPTERLLSIRADNPLYYERHRIGVYYAQSWLFVHYLLFGGRAGARTDLGYFLHSVQTGMDQAKAFELAFGTDYEGMDEALARYVRDGRYSVSSREIGEDAEPEALFGPAPAREVRPALMRLAVSAGRRDTLRTLE
jgi:hypothetical protein